MSLYQACAANVCASECCAISNNACIANTFCTTNIQGLANTAVNLGIGLIVGIAVAGVVFVVILSVSIYCCVKRCRAKNVVIASANTTTFVPMNNMTMQPMNKGMNMNMNMNNGPPPVPPPFLADNFGNQSSLMGNQSTPYGNYGNNKL